VAAYDREELQTIMDWIRRGGGLVFVAAWQPAARGQASEPQAARFSSLLRWYGVHVRADVLTVSDDAPDGFPTGQAICFPVARHPVTYGVERAVLPISSPSLWAENPSWVMMRTSPLVGSKEAGEAAPAVVTARTVGRGRVVVFANLPLTTRARAPQSPLYGNDGPALLVNALRWAGEGVQDTTSQTRNR
jgi:hypothetical protein